MEQYLEAVLVTLFYCCDQVQDKGNLRKGRFTLAHSLRVQIHPGKKGMVARESHCVYFQEAEKGTRHPVGFLLYSFRDPCPEDAAVHYQGKFSLLN